MSRPHLRQLAGLCLMAGALWGQLAERLAAEEPMVRLTRPVAWTTVFGEQEVTVDMQVAGEVPQGGRLLWSLASSERLTLVRGEAELKDEEAWQFRVAIPPVKPGVVLDAILTAHYYRPGEREPAASYESPLFVYPQDPFHDRLETLKELQIRLYDPVGETARTLAAADFPFEQIHNVAAIGELADGILVIGEGISFREDRALPELLVQVAARGIPVLCLAPRAGEFALPRKSDKSAPLASITFGTHSLVRQLDKRLDDRYWMEEAVIARHTLNPSGRGAQIAAEVDEGADGWTWIQMHFAPTSAADASTPTPPTKLLVLSLPLIEHWKSGPSPRFLFSRLVDDITPVSPELEGKAVTVP
jgi:hypothetical protein